MSDRQSVPPASGLKETATAERRLLNANAVLQKALQPFSTAARSEVVLRCDELPFVNSEEEEIGTVFSGLLQIILQRREEVSKLFLYIHCEAGEATVLRPPGWRLFSIQFKTNLPGSHWLVPHEEQLSQMAAILHKYEGCLTVNNLKNAGCLFSVSLPGKTL